MRCANDDSGMCCGKCGVTESKKVIAVIPVYGRRQLIKHTITRLLKKNGVYKVICVGEHPKDERECKAAGAEWVTHGNKTLGKKWNTGFLEAKKYNPDACLFVGSSDWVSDNWVPVLSNYINDYDLIGLPGCYLLDINVTRSKVRACHWPGYTGERAGESIGIGRMISARILDSMKWQPFEDHLEHSLDYSMQKKVLKSGGKLFLLDSNEVKSLAISTDQWPNKHRFEDHYSGKLKSIIIKPQDTVLKWFPEALEIFHTLNHTQNGMQKMFVH